MTPGRSPRPGIPAPRLARPQVAPGLRLAAACAALTPLLAACRPPAYVQPRPGQPHALLKVRHVVHSKRGPLYGSSLRLGEFHVDERTLGTEQEEASTIHFRVHPKQERIAVDGWSFHMETQTVTKYRSQTYTYSCSRYQCSGFGSSQRCGSVTQQCTGTRQVPYTELASVPVNDDSCGQQVVLDPRAGRTYVLQFDYLGENQCKMSCFEQTAAAGGDFTLTPCPVVAPVPAER